VTNPEYAIRKFMTPYMAACKKGMDPISASHSVQRSAYAQAPAKWMPESRTNVGIVTGQSGFEDVTSAGSGGDTTGARILPYEFSRGSPDKKENSWDCIGRLAEEVAWDRFMRAGELWFVSEDWLEAQSPRFRLAAGNRGVLSIEFNSDARRDADEATVTALTHRWAVLPGDLVVVENEGPGDGAWLVKEVGRDVYAATTEITLKRPTPKKKEPANETTTKTTSMGDLSNPNGVGGGPQGGPDLVQAIYRAAEQITSWNCSYSQPMRNDQKPGGHSDCSSGVSWVLDKAGVPIPQPMRPNAPVSGQFLSWGESGPGKWVTVWTNSGHIWMEFKGVGSKIRFDTSAYGDSYTGSSGGRLRSTARPSGGFTARHWKDT
jgi:hypothetical protein